MPMATLASKDSPDDSLESKRFLWKAGDVGLTEKPSPREGHCSCVVNDEVYIFGGVSMVGEGFQEKNDLWKFDISKKTWTQISVSGNEKPMSRSAATMSAVGTKIYLFGGLNQTVGWLDDFFVFDTESNSWCEDEESSGKLPSPRDKLVSTTIGKHIWFFGGFGPQVSGPLDLEDEQEADSDDDELARLERQQEAAHFGWFDDLFLYNTETKEWTQPVQLSMGKPSPRCACTMIAYKNNLVIFGGRDAEGRTNDLHLFDTVSRKWLKDFMITGTPPSARSFHSSVVVNDCLMVVTGGRGVDNNHYNDMHIFNLDTRTWSKLTVEGLTPRGCHITNAISSDIVLFGGSTDFNTSQQHCDKFLDDTIISSLDGATDGCSPEKMRRKE